LLVAYLGHIGAGVPRTIWDETSIVSQLPQFSAAAAIVLIRPLTITPDIDNYYKSRTISAEINLDTSFEISAGNSIRDTTARNYKDYLLTLASTSVQAGIAADTLTSLAELLSPHVFEPTVTHLIKCRVKLLRQSGQEGSTAQLMRAKYPYNIVHHAASILQHHFGCPTDRLSRIKLLISKLAPADTGMSPKTRRQLAVLKEPKGLPPTICLPRGTVP
jgi:hypothetical protein